MEWQGRPESDNVEDRRGFGGRRMAVGGGVGTIVIVIVGLLMGVDPGQLLQVVPPPHQQQPGVNQRERRVVDPEEERRASFSKVIFRDTEVIWDQLFRLRGQEYKKPVLVLYSGRVESACGIAGSAIGPFYCPGDSRVYIDLSFYKDMQRKLNSPGEFARAYVIAHEVGHHVQRQLDYSRPRREDRRNNKMSIRYELQADFLAGVWAHHAQQKFRFLEQGDIESALNAAFEIGDDRLQKKAGGEVVPDSFTHGTSEQRMRWFMRGFQTGDVDEGRALFELRDSEL